MTPEEILFKEACTRANRNILDERIHKIDMVMREYGEENFYISFSGGKDSTVLHHLIDLALPGNTIPRVYANTGIEYNEIVKFVKGLAEKDDRFQIIKPSVPIKQMLEKEGYPFKSKEHSQRWREFKKGGIKLKHIQRYMGLYKRINDTDELIQRYICPEKLRFQFTEEYVKNGLRISDQCCVQMKENPLHEWQDKNNKPYGILGLMREEGGRRNLARCIAFKKNGKFNFSPLVAVTKVWEDWFIEEYNIQLAPLYYPPYNFYRTGCKGCPFNITLQRELDTLDKYFPKERAQCERIWQPVYDEYRRIGYRKMRPLDEGRQMSIEEMIPEEKE